jgi:hypothetical protein
VLKSPPSTTCFLPIRNNRFRFSISLHPIKGGNGSYDSEFIMNHSDNMVKKPKYNKPVQSQSPLACTH